MPIAGSLRGSMRGFIGLLVVTAASSSDPRGSGGDPAAPDRSGGPRELWAYASYDYVSESYSYAYGDNPHGRDEYGIAIVREVVIDLQVGGWAVGAYSNTTGYANLTFSASVADLAGVRCSSPRLPTPVSTRGEERPGESVVFGRSMAY